MNNDNIPQSRKEALLENLLGADNEMQPPQSRTEAILQNMLGANNVLEPPQSREEYLLQQILEQGGTGGGDITLETLNVSANGTTNAPSGKAYNKVVANVPNSYAAGDEGKVVSNGALVAQTAHAEVTQNGTIDTTLNNSVVVNVPQSVGIGNWKLVTGTVTSGSSISTSISFDIGVNNATLIFALGQITTPEEDLEQASSYGSAYTQQEIGWIAIEPGTIYTTNASKSYIVYKKFDSGGYSYYTGNVSVSMTSAGKVTVSCTKSDIRFLPNVTFRWLVVYADVTTDTDLDTAGKPADAKAVGDALGDVAAALDAINGEVV